MAPVGERIASHEPALADSRDDRTAIGRAFAAVRADTGALAASLQPEDMVVQTMPDVSPTKWHLAHTSWFFETFVLKPYGADYRSCDPAYDYLFNSYYNQIGAQFSRPDRGHLSRPTGTEIIAYRAHVDAAMTDFIAHAGASAWREAGPLIRLGLHHEQQHQELIATDIKHVLSRNPLNPAAYAAPRPAGQPHASPPPLDWIAFQGGRVAIGRNPDDGNFAFDSEGPRHDVLLHPFRLASRPVTNGEFLAFIEDDGYRRPELWLSDGWTAVQTRGWTAPLYWRARGTGGFDEFTLYGLAPLDPAAPLVHVSYYEANAFAAWAGVRLPDEAELEIAAAAQPVAGNFAVARPAGSGALTGFHPRPAAPHAGLSQVYGDVWEWTASPYVAYPGYRPAPGAVGEYNGKFMCNQLVLRGGSCATPHGHMRATYRNFFPADARWQFSGIRLAADA